MCVCLFTPINIRNGSPPSAWCQGCDDTHICSPPPSPLPSDAHSIPCASPPHMSASHWHCPSYPLEALSNLSGLAYAGLKMPPSLHPVPSSSAWLGDSRGGPCQWALRYLMAGPTCHHCDTQACPICLSNLAETSWPDSLHADRWTIAGWIISHIHNSPAWLTDSNKQRQLWVYVRCLLIQFEEKTRGKIERNWINVANLAFIVWKLWNKHQIGSCWTR